MTRKQVITPVELRIMSKLSAGTEPPGGFLMAEKSK